MGRIGLGEILLIVAILAILFGGKKIPELARGLGQGLGEFKKALKGTDSLDSKESGKPPDNQAK